MINSNISFFYLNIFDISEKLTLFEIKMGLKVLF